MQADPENAGANIAHPQSWNAYAYVLGNPLGLVDPSGMDSIGLDSCRPGNNICNGVFSAPGKVPSGDLGILHDGWGSLYSGLTLLASTTTTSTSDVGVSVNFGFANSNTNWVSTGSSSFISVVDLLGLTPPPPPKNVSPAAWKWATGQRTPVHGLWTYGNWCGIGGSGMPKDGLDTACLMHDYCYAQAHFSAGDNLGTGNSALQACNQSLCNAAWRIRKSFAAPLEEKATAGDVQFYFGGKMSNGNGGIGVIGLFSEGNACRGPF